MNKLSLLMTLTTKEVGQGIETKLNSEDSFLKILAEIIKSEKELKKGTNSNGKLFGILFDENGTPIVIIENIALKPVSTYSEFTKIIENTVE